MNTIQKMVIGICLLVVPFLSSCGKDDPATCDYITESQAEYDALIVAQTEWTADFSNSVKCNAYKAAFQAYLNELQQHDNCVLAAQEAAYQQAIIDAQASINALQC